MPCPGQANAGAGVAKGSLSGSVTDPSSARVARAKVHVVGHAPLRDVSVDLMTDSAGHFSTTLPVGEFDVTIEAKGFEPLERDGVMVGAGGPVELNLKLRVAEVAQEVNVPSENAGSTSAGDNKSALVFDKEKLATLSDDNATMQQQLLAMAGGDGQHAPQVYVDGFTGGKFPPKSAIRQIRINQNPFSAQYESYGMGRIEIFTKPGSEKVHGSLEVGGNDAPFNARNPYAGAEPPYFSIYTDGTLSGPLGKKTSFFMNEDYFDQQNNAVVDAVNPADVSAKLSEAVPNPSRTFIYSARLDRQLSTNNTFTGRYEVYRNTTTNSGVGLLVLPSEGSNSTSTNQTLQLGNTQVVTPKIVSETRFQYIRTRTATTPDSTAPTITVQAAFSGGGSPGGKSQDNQDRYEFQEYLSFEEGKHFVRAGARYRLLRDANESTGNYNGNYTFPTLASYEAGTPQQFSLTAGDAAAKVLTGDVGVYGEDEWKVAKNLTLNYGLRFESESAVPDHADWAPRAGFAWSVGQHDKKPAVVLLRGGFGMFYDRFAAGNILTAIRQNGVSQQSYIVTNPTFYPTVPTPGSLGSGANAVVPTVYRINPHLQSQYDRDFSLSAERSLGKIGSVTVNYLFARGMHQYLSRNVNAPLPGTYDPADPASGTRPLGGTQNIYEFESSGIAKGQVIFANANLQPNKRIAMWMFYIFQNERNNESGAGSFPSDQYDLHLDYGRSASIAKQRLFFGGNVRLPWRFNLNPFLIANTGSPYNITTGTDLNGDTIFNDRPAYATDLTRTSVVKTKFGVLDTVPIAGQKIIPINLGNSPAYVGLNLQLRKSFAFGPRPAAPAADANAPKPTGPVAKPDPAYSLSFSVQAINVLNHVNPGTPIGALGCPTVIPGESLAACSPLFGHSISLSSGFFGNSAANRSILLRTEFTF